MTSSTSNSDPDRNSATPLSQPFRFPRAMMTAIAAILLIETIAYTNYHPSERIELFVPSNKIPTLVETIVEGKLQVATGKGDQVDVLVIGDSSGLMGVDPRIIRKDTGMSAYNLSTVSWVGVEGNLALYRQYIANHGDPSLIVYHFAPSELRHDAKFLKQLDFVRRVKLWIRLNEQLKEPKSKKWPKLSIEDNQVLPTQLSRTRVQSWLQWTPAQSQPLDAAIGSRESHNETLERFERQDGFIAETATTDWASAPEVLTGISNVQEKSLRELIDDTHSRGIQLILVANPLPKIAQTPANVQRLQDLETELSELVAGQPTVHLMSPVFRFYPNKKLAIQNHVAADAVARNTHEILDAIKGWQLVR